MLEPPVGTEVFILTRAVPPTVYDETAGQLVDGPSLVVADVASTVAAGGVSLVAADGASLVAADGASLVATGAGALTMTDWSTVRHSPLMMTILVLAGMGTTVLFLLGLVAYRRRRTPPYLLITLALAALVVRTVVGLGTVYGHVPMGVHHLVEHGLDFLIALFLLSAVYLSGPRSSETSEFG